MKHAALITVCAVMLTSTVLAQEPDTLNLIYPNTADTFYVGQTIDITWEGNCDSLADGTIIDFYWNFGISAEHVHGGASIPCTDKGFTWTITDSFIDSNQIDLPDANCLFEVSEYPGGQGSDKDMSRDYMMLAYDTIAPGTPGTPVTGEITDTSIALHWDAAQDNESGVTHYLVYRDEALIDTVDSTAYIDMGLSGNTSYSYTIAALDGGGNDGAMSSSVEATTNPVGVHARRSSQASQTSLSVSGSSRHGTLVFSKPATGLVSLYTLSGKKVFSSRVRNVRALRMPRNALSHGTYIVTIHNARTRFSGMITYAAGN